MKKKYFFFIFYLPLALFFPGSFLAAQNSSPKEDLSRMETPFLMPQTIFVGDSGRLVVPLGQAFSGAEPFVMAGGFPETPELELKTIELELRGGMARLFIDFVPYVPGTITLPPLSFLPEAALKALSGLEIHVTSILDSSNTVLSDPASPLTIPGTSVLVYGTIIPLIFFVFFVIGTSLWGRRNFKEIWERFRRRHLIKSMMKFLRRLKHESFDENKESPMFYLNLLSGEFREFLSFFTGVNCRSLTAGEFLYLSLGYEAMEAGSEEAREGRFIKEDDRRFLKPVFLCDLFHTWDKLRFCGRDVDRVDLFLALKETGNFITALDMAEKEKPVPVSLPIPAIGR